MSFIPEPGFDVGMFFIGKELKWILNFLKGHTINRPIILIRFHNQATFIHIQILPITMLTI